MFSKKLRAISIAARFAWKGYTSKLLPDLRHECSDLLDTLGLEVHLRGTLPHGPCLILANHLSYLDIPILATLAPIRFVTSYELRDEAITGHIAKLGHSIFVERRNYSTILDDVKTMYSALHQGENVCLFPEGTTTSGQMGPWKSSLVQAAMLAPRAHVVPVAIQYLEIDKRIVSPENRDKIYYYGGMEFKKHFSDLLHLKQVKVRITILPPVQGKNRKELTRRARRAVETVIA